jgi:hypothetical protein
MRASFRKSIPNEAFERRIWLYVLAAGAAAGCAPAAQAKVVFTPSNAVLHPGEHLDIDLNNDGKNDFRLADKLEPSTSRGYISELWMYGDGGNGVFDQRPANLNAVAFTKGSRIGGTAYFSDFGALVTELSSDTTGNFINTSRKFLGVRFLINGKVHYGWIGFRSVQVGLDLVATLAGWAYETQPNTPIVAGDLRGGTTDSEEAAMTAAPRSLELLAAGNVALVDWRRRRTG